MQENKIQKDIYLKFNFPEKLKYKYLINDEYNISNENFSFEKKKGLIPMEHEFKVNSSLYIFYQIPEIFTNKIKMKEQLLNSELVNFKFNYLLNALSINSKIHTITELDYEKNKILNNNCNNKSKLENTIENKLTNSIPINGKEFTKGLSINGKYFTNSIPVNKNELSPNELPNTIPINENGSIPMDENNLPNTIPINEDEIPNNMDENIIENTVPINKNEILNNIPIDENILPNTVPIDDDEMLNNIPIDVNNLQNTVPIDEDGILNDIPIDENNLPNTIPINENILPNTIPVDENILPNTVPIDENILPNTVPIDENILPNTVPVDENILPNTVPVDENILLNNEDEIPNTVPIIENDIPNTIPIIENDIPNTIPINDNYDDLISTQNKDNGDQQFSNSSKKKNSTFLKPNDPFLPNNNNINNNNNNTQPYELVNDFSQVTQTQNYDATQEYIENETQDCIQVINDNSPDDVGKNNEFDEIIIPGTESEFENSLGYTLSNINRSFSDIDDDEISNKRSFLQLDEYDSIISNSNGYSSSKRKKIDNPDSDSDEVYAPQSDDEIEKEKENNANYNTRRTFSDLTSNKNKNIYTDNADSDSYDEMYASKKDNEKGEKSINNIRKTVSDLTFSKKDKNKYNSQDYNPIFLDSQNLSSSEFNNFISPNNEKNKDYLETQIISQNTDIKDNKYIETQKIPSLSQESLIFTPNKLENQNQQQSQEYMFISPSDIHRYMETGKTSSQGEELLSPKMNQYNNESSKMLSPEGELLSPRMKQLIETQKESLENDDEIMMEGNDYYAENQGMSSQGRELLSPENNFENELNTETQKIVIDFESPLSNRNNINLNQMQMIETQKIPSQDQDLKSPKYNIFSDTQKILSQNHKINTDTDIDIMSDNEPNSQYNSNQSNSMKSPELLFPKINLNNKYPLTKRIKHENKDKDIHMIDKSIPITNLSSPTLDLILPDNNSLIETQKIQSQDEEALPLKIEEAYHIEESYQQENKKDKKMIYANQDNNNDASFFSINSKLNDGKEQILDEKSINQDVDNIKLLPSQNDDFLQEDQDQSINNSQCSSNNLLFSPGLYQEEPLSPEIIIIKKGNNSQLIANKENVNSNGINPSKLYENNVDKENENNIKNIDFNDSTFKSKLLDRESLTKTPDSEFNKNSELQELEINTSMLINNMNENENENYPKFVKTDSNIFVDNHSQSFIENETLEENIINNFIEEYLNKTNILENFNNNIIPGNILDGLKTDSPNKKIKTKKKLKGKESLSGSSQESSENNYLFYSSPIPVLKNRNSDDLSSLSEKEIKIDLEPAFDELSLDNKLHNENESNEKVSNLMDINKLNTSGLIVSPSHVQTPNNSIPVLIKESSNKKKEPSFLNHPNKDRSFINLGNNSEFSISSESYNNIMNTPTPINPNFIFNEKDEKSQINKITDNNNYLKVNTHKTVQTNPTAGPSTPKEHSLNSLSFINVPKHSPEKLQYMLSSESSNPKDFGLPSSIPKTISSISSFEDNLLEEDKHYPIILPPDIEIVDSLKILVKQYEKDIAYQESQEYKSATQNSNTYKYKKKYNFIGLVVQVNNTESLQPKNKNKNINIFDSTDNSIQISSVNISDQTHSFFPVMFWRNYSNWNEKISVGDVVLFINLTLSKFKNKVMANTIGWGNNSYSSRFYIIKNINSKSTLNLSNTNIDFAKRVIDIQNWAKYDPFTKFLFKDSDQCNSEPQSNCSTFITVKQLINYKNKYINIQGIPISTMKDIKISDDHESYELWKVEIIDVDNNRATIQILMAFSSLLQYIHINEKQLYNFYNLIIYEESNKDLVLYATKNTKIQTSNNISENIQGKVIEYLKNIEPKDFDTLESLIKTRYNGLARVDAFISKIIFNRTNNSDPLEYSVVESSNSYKSNKKRDSINDIIDTIQIYCNKCNEFVFQNGATNITSLINGIRFKDTVDQKINYFIEFLVQKAFWNHCHHLKELSYVYSPIQLILQDTNDDANRTNEEAPSSPMSSPSYSPLSTNSIFNSLFVFLDIHATTQFYQKLKPEDFIKIRGGLKRRGRKPTSTPKQITLTMVQNHLRKTDPFKLALSTANESTEDSIHDDSHYISTPDFTSKSVDIAQATIFEDILTILSFEKDPTVKIDFDTDRQVSVWNQNLNKILRPLKKKKNSFVLSCNIQENELKTNLYNIGPIYCKEIRKR